MPKIDPKYFQLLFLIADSGHSTMRDMNDVNDDTELDSVSVQSDMRRSRRHKRLRTGMRVQEEEVGFYAENLNQLFVIFILFKNFEV